jgi:hypothetical protein
MPKDEQPHTKPHVCRVLVRPSFLTLQAVLTNVTPASVSLVLPCELERGAVLSLLLPAVLPGLSNVQSVRVGDVRPCGERGWDHFCTLSRPLSLQELVALT